MIATILVCTINIVVNAGGFGAFTKADVEGKLVSQSDTKYLVDFSEGVKKYELMGKPSDYSQVLVDKYECVKK
jgi:hypothetical protein